MRGRARHEGRRSARVGLSPRGGFHREAKERPGLLSLSLSFSSERLERLGEASCIQVGRCARLIPLGHHEPFLSLSRPERPVARPTARQSRGSVRRRECTRVPVPSPRAAKSTRRGRCVRDRKACPLGANTEAQVARTNRVEAGEKRDI